MKNPATKGGADSGNDDLLGGDLFQNKPLHIGLQARSLMLRFSLPVATAAVVAEIAFTSEATR